MRSEKIQEGKDNEVRFTDSKISNSSILASSRIVSIRCFFPFKKNAICVLMYLHITTGPDISQKPFNFFILMISRLCDELIEKCQEPSVDSSFFHKFSLASIKLKRLNRNQLLALDSRRCEVEQTKERVGQAQLTLENLLYKQSYLLREIQISKDFVASELAETEAELKLSLSIPEYTSDLKEKHRSILEYLENELKLRHKLEQDILIQQTSLNDRTEALMKKRKLLEEFPEKLKLLKTAASELGETYLDNDLSTADMNINLLVDLPTPLFIIFRTFHSSISQNSATVKIVPTQENDRSILGQFAIELSIYNQIDSNLSMTQPSHATFLFQYHQRCNVVLVIVKNIIFYPQSLSFPFQSLVLSQCLLPSQYRNSIFLSESIDPQYGKPEMWAQWLAGFRPLPSKDFEKSTLTSSSFTQLVRSLINYYYLYFK